jgi:hypothetical protein
VVPSWAATDVLAVAAGFDFTCVLSRLTGVFFTARTDR